MNLEAGPIRIRSIFSVEEIESLFRDLASEVFQSFPQLEERGALLVHLFPDLTIPGDHIELGNLFLNREHVLESFTLDSGTLSRCHMHFPRFGASFDWFHFVHRDWESRSEFVRDRLVSNGINPVHEWVISHMQPDAIFGRHRDALSPWLRYSFVVRQPPAQTSINVGFTDYFFPTGETYIMDGDIPHEVINASKGARIMLLGNIDSTDGCIPCEGMVNGS